jgi:outer membrane protein OmpA-like peptidoglycan-associated protein
MSWTIVTARPRAERKTVDASSALWRRRPESGAARDTQGPATVARRSGTGPVVGRSPFDARGFAGDFGAVPAHGASPAEFEGDEGDGPGLLADREPADHGAVSELDRGHAATPTVEPRCGCGRSAPHGECASCRQTRGLIQRNGRTTPAREAPASVHEVLRTPGRAFDRTTRAAFESRFGQSFDHVRLHDDARAHASAQAIGARAYTVGEHMVFGAGALTSETLAGRHLLAHELTHVLQQRSASPSPGVGLAIGRPHDAAEGEADRTAHAVASGKGDVPQRFTAAGALVQRACGAAAIGARAAECADRDPLFVTGHPVFRFDVNCDDFAAGEEARLRGVAAALPAAGPIVVHGYASTDGDPDFNEHLSCARARRAEAVLSGPGGAGIDPARVTTERHGPTPGPAADRRSVVIEAAAPVPVPPGPPPTPLTVAFTRVRADTSPAGMPDRIPPRVDTIVGVGVVGWHPPLLPVTLSIDGAGGGNGEATINGAATVDVTASTAVNLRGTTQTTPGNAGNLHLVAEQGGGRLATSNAFSVSAIPQNFSITFNSLVTGARRGIRVNNHWESDSGVVADLDQAERSEQVEYGAGTGIFAGVTGVNSGYLPAHNPPRVDSHSVGTALLTGAGTLTANQTFIFRDHRTGAADIPVRNSGFLIARRATPLFGVVFFTTSKSGAAVTANGFASAAGAGAVSRTQIV